VLGAPRLGALAAPQLRRRALARAASIRPACHALVLGETAHEPRRIDAAAAAAAVADSTPVVGSAGGSTPFAGVAGAESRRLRALVPAPPPPQPPQHPPLQLVATRTAWAALENLREACGRAGLPPPPSPPPLPAVAALEGRR